MTWAKVWSDRICSPEISGKHDRFELSLLYVWVIWNNSMFRSFFAFFSQVYPYFSNDDKTV